jgi:hypothetical protein
MITTVFGYLEAAYLLSPYLTTTATVAIQSQIELKISQVERSIEDFTDEVRSQIDQKIIDVSVSLMSQIESRIDQSDPIASQLAALIVDADKTALSQIDQSIVNLFSANTQLEAVLEKDASISSQISEIINKDDAVKQQFDQKIITLVPTLSQVDLKIDGSSSALTQLDLKLGETALIPSQLSQTIEDSDSYPSQLDQVVPADLNVKSQLENGINKTRPIGSQLSLVIDNGSKTVHRQLSIGPVSHQTCDGYLTEGYLSGPYLAPFICAHLRQQIEFLTTFTDETLTQISGKLDKTTAIRGQLDQKIDSSRAIRSQLDRKISLVSDIRSQLQRSIDKTVSIRSQLARTINASRPINMQLLRTASYTMKSQLLLSIYNTTNLRILCDFPSRGTSGTNWTVVAGGTTAGDFSVNNLNTDIVEQVYRSTTTTITIQCDTQVSQGIFNDTLAILGHNFTTSAIVNLQGSNDVGFSSTPFSETLPVELENLYWISEYLPLTSYRYWRLVVSDVTNTAGYIQIGTVVFGPSIIFSGECFVDEVVRRKTHFADRIRTEGYSAVSNDRALKRSVSLSFKRLNYNRENYASLSDVIDTARTSLKCLWIPTPQFASRFAVFGKLAEIPVENHKAISATADYIDLDITVDEAL